MKQLEINNVGSFSQVLIFVRFRERPIVFFPRKMLLHTSTVEFFFLFSGVPIQLPMLNMFSQDDGRVLVIKSMRKEASDVYSCVASNVVNQVMVKSKIDVLPPGECFLI